MTVSRLLSEVSSTEIAAWMVFSEIEDENRTKRAESEKQKRAAANEKVLQARLTQAGIAAAKKKAHGKAKI